MKNKSNPPDIDEFTNKIAQHIFNTIPYKDSWFKDTSTCNCGNCSEYSCAQPDEIAAKIKEAMIAVYGVG